MDERQSIVAALKALADPVRLSILEFLWSPSAEEFRTDGGICALDLQEFLGVTQPTVSYHMKILVHAGVVTAEKRGKWVYYECVTEGLDEVIAYLDRFRHPAEEKLFGGR
ncbi:MAG: metalloregulator ArsR/SmtB family transcription factor [Actinomycetota bacterium]|jgi:ArsR family transcriptional regulator|nr:winged helix-turn-helix transcriptional regulator [Rubrobacter sp.]MDQ3509681.1 metalloregulator ArsR/SmtB family transcription factor [Actinomycetota bacterium]